MYATKVVRNQTDPTALSQGVFKTTPIKMIPCRELSKEDRDLQFGVAGNEYEEGVFKLSALCPNTSVDKSLFTVSGKASSFVEEFILLSIYPCVAELSPNGCVSTAEAARFGVYMIPTLMSINLANFENPLSYQWNTDLYYNVNLGSSLSYFTRMKMIEVWNSNGMFTEDTLVARNAEYEFDHQYYMYRDPTKTSCTLAEMNKGACPAYFFFRLGSGGQKFTYTRYYKGFLEIISDVGGLRDVVFTICFYMYTLLKDREAKKRLVTAVYTDEKQGIITGPENVKGQTFSANKLDVDKAYELIETNLDVVNVIQKLNFLDILISYFDWNDSNNLSIISYANYQIHQGKSAKKAGKSPADENVPPSLSKSILSSASRQVHEENKLNPLTEHALDDHQPAGLTATQRDKTLESQLFQPPRVSEDIRNKLLEDIAAFILLKAKQSQQQEIDTNPKDDRLLSLQTHREGEVKVPEIQKTELNLPSLGWQSDSLDIPKENRQTEGLARSSIERSAQGQTSVNKIGVSRPSTIKKPPPPGIISKLGLAKASVVPLHAKPRDG